ncbi:LysR family transcriptional regulator [Advenella sp. WQ 585]|uniref:LysR family transcriptional regulator n=1 Tax=Advenella mandrilli TaxID=2800330 RepID=A0ABS1ECP9_9BURK|nr:LysR family transcriptional regulator [Advenella mandrilli]MBK1781672.1 LysR family transcriptional regulator [Advenella mandrilli]
MIQFCHLCQTQHLAKSAEQLQIARSGLSETVRFLENKFKLKLFRRTNKKFLPTETALVLSNGFHLLGLLESFARRNVNTAHHELSWVKIKFPVHFYCGDLSKAFFQALYQCAEKFPKTLFWPEFTNSYFEGGLTAEGWEPGWYKISQSDIVINAQSGHISHSGFLKTGQWVMLHAQSVLLEQASGVQDIRQHKLILPRMPWSLLQQAANICTEHDFSFGYDENDYIQLLSDPPRSHKVVLLNEIFLDPAFDSHWTVTPLLCEERAVMQVAHYDEHPVLRYFEQVFSQCLADAEPASCGFQPATSLKQWHYFDRVLETGSMRKAAHELFLAQPAISTQIRHFEQALNTVAINRKKGSRSMDITPSGLFLADIAKGMQEVLGGLETYLSSQQLQQCRHLSLGVLPSVDVHSKLSELIVNQVAKWQQYYPDVRLEILEDKQSVLTALLRSQHIHLAFIETKVPWLIQDSVSVPEEMGIVISPVLLQAIDAGKKKKLGWPDIKHYPLVLPRRGSGLRTLIDQHCFEQGIVLQAEVDSDSLNINQRWIVEGKYAAILPQSAADSLIQAGQAVFLPLYPSLKRILRLSYLKNRPLNDVEKNLIDFLRFRIEAYSDLN